MSALVMPSKSVAKRPGAAGACSAGPEGLPLGRACSRARTASATPKRQRSEAWHACWTAPGSHCRSTAAKPPAS
eukprot:4124080-Lingulodinium_polyedra.AAC.1